jgi:hypothetical protein
MVHNLSFVSFLFFDFSICFWTVVDVQVTETLKSEFADKGNLPGSPSSRGEDSTRTCKVS